MIRCPASGAETQSIEGQTRRQLPIPFAVVVPTRVASSPGEADAFLKTRTTALPAAVPPTASVVAAVICGASTDPCLAVKLPCPSLPMSMNRSLAVSPLAVPRLRSKTFPCGSIPPPVIEIASPPLFEIRFWVAVVLPPIVFPSEST